MRRTGGRRRPVIGILTPFVGGSYFGGIVSGAAAACQAAGADLVVVQTYDAGMTHSDVAAAPDFTLQVGHDVVDGWMVIINAVERPYIEDLRAAGVPVVLVSAGLAGEPCPTVMPDNRKGVLEAVRHLIDHGHTRIAFLGRVEQRDIQERHEAYCEALTAAGLPVDPALLFQANDNMVRGGLQAAAGLLAAGPPGGGLPATAVMAGTDLNAIGLMEAVRSAGYVLPRDLAIIGFDDMELAAQSDPPLTTISQPLGEIGATAVGLLLAGVRGEQLEAGARYLAGELVVRNSCGCTEPTESEAAGAARNLINREAVTSQLGEVVKTQYEVSMELLTSRGGEAASLHWLSWTLAQAGCLALSISPDGGTEEPLRYIGSYRKDAPPGVPLGELVTVRGFPPDAMLAAAEEMPGDTLFLVPVKSGKTDRGLLAVIAPLERVVMIGRELVNQWAALLGVALDHEAALASLEEQRARLHDGFEREQQLIEEVRLSEQRYALAAQASNDGLWDWDIPHGTMYWSDRWRAMAGFKPDQGSGPEDWFARVHPDDLPGLRAAITDHLANRTPTVEHEHRMGRVGGVDRWVQCRAIGLRDAGGLVTRLVGSTTDVTERKVLEQRLRHDAFHDGLTGLPNRALFLERLDRAVEHSRRHPEHEYAVLFVDLDRFKAVNDTLGHAVGDLVLSAIGARLTASLRGHDTAARFGGDEFAVLVTDVESAAKLHSVADRLRRRIEEPIEVPGESVVLSASIGIARSGGASRSAAQLLREADMAMYRAKTGGGGYSVYDRTIDPPRPDPDPLPTAS